MGMKSEVNAQQISIPDGGKKSSHVLLFIGFENSSVPDMDIVGNLEIILKRFWADKMHKWVSDWALK